MCGICGVIQIGGVPREVVDPVALDHMTDVMTHRGPNDRGVHTGAGIGIGARRLSIIDLDRGHQPLANEDGTVWAALNGEIYNHDELRRRLQRAGHRFTSRCDTEVLPHLYEAHGPDFVHHLRGMFGAMVWDQPRRRAVVVRDRLGVKPLYWAQVCDRVVFASELKSVLASGLVPVELDLEAIDAYLTLGYVPGPMTPIAGVRKLLPGQRLIVDPDGIALDTWWQVPRSAPDRSRNLAEHAGALLARLDEAVKIRLMSDVPLGLMLSGGLDSSLILALMARHTDRPVPTFSVGFHEDTGGNELDEARFVAEHFGSEHHELRLSLTDPRLNLAELAWHLDEPVADLSSLGFHALSGVASRHVTVALAGQGADELLGGYRKHQAAALVGRWQQLPDRVRGPAQALAQRAGTLAPRRLGRSVGTLTATDPAARLVSMSQVIDPAQRQRLARGPLAALPGGAAYRALTARSDGLDDDPLGAALQLDLRTGLVDDMLHYFDRASMAHALEIRVPFLDHELVEHCATIPPELKVRGLRTKHVLREAATGVLPRRVIDRPKIGFFRSAMRSWITAQIDGQVADHLLSPSPRFAELIDTGEVARLVQAHRDQPGRADPRPLVVLLMLDLWFRSLPG